MRASQTDSSSVPAFTKHNHAATKEPQQNTLNYLSSYHQRSSSENGANYVPYSPYAYRRKEIISRPFSPPQVTSKDNSSIGEYNESNNIQRSYSPYRQHIEQQNHDLSALHCTPSSTNNSTTNGQNRSLESRSFSPYRQDANLIDVSSRPYSPYGSRLEERDSSKDRWQNVSRSLSPFARDYSPWRRENVDPPGVVPSGNSESGRFSPFIQRFGPPVPQTHSQTQDIYGSPMVSRKRFPSEPPPQGSHGSTSPQLLISRFAHQLKQEPPQSVPPVQAGSKESAKKRFASYVRLRLGSERAPSPEPPPRLSRGESPLALRRNLIDQPSPSFSRRYVSPSPPQPPPRRLSESNSVPGSPQHVRARLRYTPEPQRRPPPP